MSSWTTLAAVVHVDRDGHSDPVAPGDEETGRVRGVDGYRQVCADPLLAQRPRAAGEADKPVGRDHDTGEAVDAKQRGERLISSAPVVVSYDDHIDGGIEDARARTRYRDPALKGGEDSAVRVDGCTDRRAVIPGSIPTFRLVRGKASGGVVLCGR